MEENRFYSRKDLVGYFRQLGHDWDAIAERIKPRQVFRGLYLGSDILDAWRKYQVKENMNKVSKPTKYPVNSIKKSKTPTGETFDKLLKEVRKNG